MSPYDREGGSRGLGKMVFWGVTLLLGCVLLTASAFVFKMYADVAFTNMLADKAITWLQGQKRITDEEVRFALNDLSVVVSQKASVDFTVDKTETHTIFGKQLPKELWGAVFRNTGVAFVFAGVDLQETPYSYEVRGDTVIVTLPHARVLTDMSSLREAHTTVVVNGVLNRFGDAFSNGGQNAIDVKEELDKQALNSAIERSGPELVRRADDQLQREVISHLMKLGFKSVKVQWDKYPPH